MLKTASRLGEVKEYYFSKKLREIAQMREKGANILNLGIGSPDLAPADTVINTLTQSVTAPDNHAYQSYVGIPELRAAFANWYWGYFDVRLNPQNEILPLIGSKEGIMHISMTYLEKGDAALIPNPGYPTYRAVTNLTGATAIDYELLAENNWLPDLDKLAQQDLSKVKIMWVNYPNMPTGARGDLSFFHDLIDFAKTYNILIVNDNPYSFILNEQPNSLLQIEGAKEVALELNSLSKSHNMAGWRMGMLAGKADYLQNILRFKSNMDSGMFRPIQLAAVEALNNPPSWYQLQNKIYQARREKVLEMLTEINCTFDTNTVGLFVWAKVSKLYRDGYELSDELLEKAHVFLTPGGIFGSQGNSYVRVSLCAKKAVYEEAISRIKNIRTTVPVI